MRSSPILSNRLAWRREWSALWPIALPLALVQFGNTLTGMVDTAIAGRSSELDLAATGLGSAIFFAGSVLGLGCGYGADPLIAQAFGAGRLQDAYRWLWQGLYLALFASVPLWGFCTLISWALPSLGVEPELATAARIYLDGRLLSLLPFCLISVLRSYLQAAGRNGTILNSTIAMNLFNLVADWLLLFGDPGLVRLGLPACGLPAMGVFGLGVASSLATLLQAAMLGFSVWRMHRRRPPVPATGAAAPVLAPVGGLMGPRWVDLRRLFDLGLPAGLHILAEAGTFSLIALLAGRVGTMAAAAHQCAIMLVSGTFGACLGVGAAATVRVGHAIGRGDNPGVRLAGVVSLSLGGGLMVVASLLMLLCPQALMRLMTDRPAVIESGSTLLQIASLFQVVDGLQAVLAGALRGAGITRYTFLVNLVSHWGIGMPLAFTLAFYLQQGVRGLWWGLTLGLCLVCLALWRRFSQLLRAPIVALEAEPVAG
jgi:MATE family multidrug resistance protein